MNCLKTISLRNIVLFLPKRHLFKNFKDNGQNAGRYYMKLKAEFECVLFEAHFKNSEEWKVAVTE